jgi:hypothetical protein
MPGISKFTLDEVSFARSNYAPLLGEYLLKHFWNCRSKRR